MDDATKQDIRRLDEINKARMDDRAEVLRRRRMRTTVTRVTIKLLQFMISDSGRALGWMTASLVAGCVAALLLGIQVTTRTGFGLGCVWVSVAACLNASRALPPVMKDYQLDEGLAKWLGFSATFGSVAIAIFFPMFTIRDNTILAASLVVATYCATRAAHSVAVTRAP